MSEFTVITKSPISAAYRARLEKHVGSPIEVANITELQRSGVRGVLAGVRRIRTTRVLIPVEDESVRAQLPMLQLLAGLTRAERMEIVGSDLRREPFRLPSLFLVLLRLLRSSASNVLAALRCFGELEALPARRPVQSGDRNDRSLLYVNANLWLGLKAGGSVGHISGVVNAFLRKGYACIFAACGGRLMVDERADYFPLNAPNVFGFPLELNSYRFHRENVRQLAALLRTRRPRFIYQRLSLGNYSGVTLSRMFGIPLVTEYNGSEVWVSKHWGRPLRFVKLAQRAEDTMLRGSRIIVTVSEVLRQELVERGIDTSRIVMYPNCIDEHLFDPSRYDLHSRAELREAHGIPGDSVVVTFVGTFGRWHGVDVLARAIRALATNESAWLRAHRVRFLLVGDGLKMSEVRKELSDAGVAAYIVLTGLVPQPQAPAYLAASDILVSPHVANSDGTKFFGSPTKLFEYMAMGKGIVASDLDQIGQVLAHSLRVGQLPIESPGPLESRQAVLTQPGSLVELISGIKFLVERPDWRAILGQNVRQEVLKRYTWGHHVDAILDRISEIEAAPAEFADHAALPSDGV